MEKRDEHMDFGTQVVKYLSGEMTAAEKRSFVAEIRKDSDKRAVFEACTKIWVGLDQVAAEAEYDMDREWSDLAAKVGIVDRALADEKSQAAEKTQVAEKTPIAEKTQVTDRSRIAGGRLFGSVFIRIAAAVVIGLISVTILYTVRQASMFDRVALETGTEEVKLPDGSVVTLNRGSSIRFFSNADQDTRKVMLSGEAFFEVTRDTLRPFVIDAGGATIEVLGTSFNVSAYEDEETVEVVVNTGLVAMSSKKTSDNLIIMNPGNGGVFDAGREELKLIQKADRNEIAWKTRELVFSATPLIEALEDISHAYQVDMKLVSEELADSPITVSFSGQELGAVIRVLESMLDLEIRREGEGYWVGWRVEG